MIDMATYDLISRALLAGAGIVLMAGPLGCFILWRRLVFLGDTLAHAALLGVAIALILETNMILTVLLFSIVMALFISWMTQSQRMASDTSLGLVSYGALATGMLAFTKIPGPVRDPSHYLFGDILLVSTTELVWIYASCMLVLSFLYWRWRALLLWTISPELAHTRNINIKVLHFQFVLVLSLIVTLTLKIAGVLLAPALLILPAASAGQIAKSPQQMIGLATGLGLFMFVSGFGASWYYDLPTGPAVVFMGIICFIMTSIMKRQGA
ncbi:MAG: metal ABC transporter permease [Alphaproteobacteria bacterium]